MGASAKPQGLSWICRLFPVGRPLRRKETGALPTIPNSKRNAVKKAQPEPSSRDPSEDTWRRNSPLAFVRRSFPDHSSFCL